MCLVNRPHFNGTGQGFISPAGDLFPYFGIAGLIVSMMKRF